MSALEPELALARRRARGLGGHAPASPIHERGPAPHGARARDGHARRHRRGRSCAHRMGRALESADRRPLGGRRSPRHQARAPHPLRVPDGRRRDGRGPVPAARRHLSRPWRSARSDLPTRRVSADARGDDHSSDRPYGTGQGRQSGQPAQPMLAGDPTLRRDRPIAELITAREVALFAVDPVDGPGRPAENGRHRSAAPGRQITNACGRKPSPGSARLPAACAGSGVAALSCVRPTAGAPWDRSMSGGELVIDGALSPVSTATREWDMCPGEHSSRGLAFLGRNQRPQV